ncbi:MAG: DUF1573 domain-containing protein [Rikenellaceae bacterium]
MNYRKINYRLFFFCIFTLVSAFSYAQSLTLSKETLNLGDVKVKEKVEISLYAKNVSSEPLVIKDEYLPCKCTKVSYSRKPIMPGDSTFVKVTYEAKEEGAFYKSVVLFHSGKEKTSTFNIRGTGVRY